MDENGMIILEGLAAKAAEDRATVTEPGGKRKIGRELMRACVELNNSRESRGCASIGM
jgi:hypothetical protein